MTKIIVIAAVAYLVIGYIILIIAETAEEGLVESVGTSYFLVILSWPLMIAILLVDFVLKTLVQYLATKIRDYIK